MRGGLHCGSAYLRDSEGASPANLAILEALAGALEALRRPWIIVGNWNLTPQELADTGWLERGGGYVVATCLPTCNAKVYDYFIVAQELRHAIVGVQRLADVGGFPHTAVRLVMAQGARRQLVRRGRPITRIGGKLPAKTT